MKNVIWLSYAPRRFKRPSRPKLPGGGNPAFDQLPDQLLYRRHFGSIESSGVSPVLREVVSGEQRSALLDATMPEVEYLELMLDRLPEAFDGIRILHLSDLHITRWTAELQHWSDQISPLQPDLAVITGDLGHRSWKWKKTLPNVQRLMSAIHTTLGTYFILGNHDSLELGPALVAGGAVMLVNESVIIERGGQRMALIGVAQHRRSDTDIPAAMRNVQSTDFKLMLLHYPDLIHSAAAAGVDVCLAGHTHGGQICYPDGSPIIGHDVLPANMCTGLNRIADTWLIVNRGIGKAGLRLRLFCPPQVMMLTLRTRREDSAEFIA